MKYEKKIVIIIIRNILTSSIYHQDEKKTLIKKLAFEVGLYTKIIDLLLLIANKFCNRLWF